MYKINK